MAQRVRVKIGRAEHGWPVTVEGGPMPSIAAVEAVIPTMYRRKLTQRTWRNMKYSNRPVNETAMIRNYLDSALCTSQQLADWIGQASITQMAVSLEAVAEWDGEPDGDNPFMAVKSNYLVSGDRVYRLAPVEIMKSGRVLATLRKQAAEEIARMRAAAEVTLASQREQMLDAARQEQVVLVQQAHRERDEAVRLRREAAGGNRMVCPNWLSHRVVRFVEGSSVMYIRVPLTIRFREFTRDVIGRDGLTVTHHWRIPEEQQPVTTHQMFLALNTSTWAPMLASSYVEVDSNGRMLPHANQSQFCVEPQGMPMEVRNWEGVVAVAALVARAYHVVNLGSLLTRYSQWPRQLQEVTPEPFRVDSINDIDWSAAIAALVGDRHEAIPANVEAATTWQVEVQRAR